MQEIDADRLNTDVVYRFQYVSGFVGFGEEDISTIKGCAEAIGPLVPTVVDAVYNKLFSYDVTKKVFLMRNKNFNGDLATGLEEIDLEDPQIKFRMDMLSKYLVKLVTAEYDEKFIKYLDFVGKVHTPKGLSKRINVDYIHCNALFGYVHDVLNSAIFDLGLPHDTTKQVIRSFSKLLWIQNDLFARHFIDSNQKTVE
eukprot:Nk52_evm28s2531 gene=Nk52_evmTU28s2531